MAVPMATVGAKGLIVVLNVVVMGQAPISLGCRFVEDRPSTRCRPVTAAAVAAVTTRAARESGTSLRASRTGTYSTAPARRLQSHQEDRRHQRTVGTGGPSAPAAMTATGSIAADIGASLLAPSAPRPGGPPLDSSG